MTQNKTNILLIHKNLMVVWLGLFTTQIVFLIISFVVRPELRRPDFKAPILGAQPMMVVTFGILALVLLAGSFAVAINFRTKARQAQNPDLVQSGMIVSCAMCETASIFGLVLAFSYSYQYFFVFIAASMAAMAYHFPSQSSLINASYGKRL